jgi:hypothetical protein
LLPLRAWRDLLFADVFSTTRALRKRHPQDARHQVADTCNVTYAALQYSFKTAIARGRPLFLWTG